MLRRRGRALCRQPRPGKSWVKQTQLSTFVDLEFPLSKYCRLLKYEEEGKVQKGRQWQTSWQKQGCMWKRTPVECFKGHMKGDSTWNWCTCQSLNKLTATLTCLESSRRKDLRFEQGKSSPVMATFLHSSGNNREHNARCTARKCVQQGRESHHTK